MKRFLIMRAFFVTFVDLFFIDGVKMFIFYNRFFYMGNFSRVYMLDDFLVESDEQTQEKSQDLFRDLHGFPSF